MQWAGGLITIDAEAMPRTAVLAAIAREASVDITGLDALPARLVTLRVTRAPLLDTVQRLIADVPALLVEERDAAGHLRLVSVRLFARSAGERKDPDDDAAISARAADDDGPDSGDDGALREALLRSDDEERAQAALEALEAREPQALITTLLTAARSADSGERLHALRMLDRAGRIDSGTAIAALHDAAHDDDDAIRGFAIGALAIRGTDGMSALQRMFRSADRDVRLMVLQAVSERDDASPLLHEAITDSDVQVRQFAASRLSKPEAPGGG